ncbi:MAG: hypothetical protein RLZZ417_782 [Bacteroidota bacterium]|jgi:hypothetical protein
MTRWITMLFKALNFILAIFQKALCFIMCGYILLFGFA